MIYIGMVKKIKVVDVATEEVKPIEETKPIEEVKDVEDVQPVEEIKDIEPVEVVVEAVKDVKEEIKPKKQPEYVNCENCNKKVLMKTYKYSHLNVCKGKKTPPAPPQAPAPPPTPSPEKPKRAKQKEEPIIQEKPEFHGVVSFSNPDPYTILRQERALIRQQRVKSLISQAI